MSQIGFLKSLTTKRVNYNLVNPCNIKEHLLKIYKEMGLLENLFNFGNSKIIRSNNPLIPNSILTQASSKTSAF